MKKKNHVFVQKNLKRIWNSGRVEGKVKAVAVYQK